MMPAAPIIQKRSYSEVLQLILTIGLGLLILIAPLLQGLYFPGQLLPALVALGIIFICAMARQWLYPTATPVRHLLDLAIAALCLAYALSLTGAVHLYDAILELMKVIACALVYWLAVHCGQRHSAYEPVLLAAYGTALIMALIGLGASLGWINFYDAYADGHIRSVLQYHNALAVYLTAATLLGLAFAARTCSSRVQALFTGGNYLLLLTIIGTLSRGTWLLYLPVLALFIFLIPAGYRGKALYSFFAAAIIAMIAGRFFYNSLEVLTPLFSFLILLAGFLAAMALGACPARFLDGFQLRDLRSRRWVRPAVSATAAALLLLVILHPAPASLLQWIAPQVVVDRITGTSLEEESYQDRAAFIRDAAAIIRDYPFTGAGGGGWQALYHTYADRLYWSGEVHNYYLKTGVEAGVLGMTALGAVIIIFILLLLKIHRKAPADEEAPVIWAAALAVVAILLHSVFDFEMSYPGIAFFLFALLGILRAYAARLEQAGRENLPKAVSGKNQVRLIRLASAGGIILALALGGSAGAFNLALALQAQGAEALNRQDLLTARSCYERAGRLAPFHAANQTNLALVEAIRANKDPNSAEYSQAIAYAEEAARLEPFTPELRLTLAQAYGMLELPSQQLAEIKAAIAANPFAAQPYEELGRCAMNYAWAHLDKGELESARYYFSVVLQERKQLPSVAEGDVEVLTLGAGQAALFLGDYDAARQYLTQAGQSDESYEQVAHNWLAGLDYLLQKDPPASAPLSAAAVQELYSFLRSNR